MRHYAPTRVNVVLLAIFIKKLRYRDQVSRSRENLNHTPHIEHFTCNTGIQVLLWLPSSKIVHNTT